MLRGDSSLGLTRGEVALRASDPLWREIFERLAAQLRQALSGRAAAIEHVGSTAVPGLRAKPILDIAIGLSADASPIEATERLEAAGFEFRGDKGDRGGLLFVLEDAPAHRIAHIHVVAHDELLWRRYLAVRDRLREDTDARAVYEALKEHLAAEFPHDRASYTAGKESFIRNLLDDARPGSVR